MTQVSIVEGHFCYLFRILAQLHVNQINLTNAVDILDLDKLYLTKA